jgi:catechol 2,3-dioxygenase-like lactoylglutathione lyase family enzyme
MIQFNGLFPLYVADELTSLKHFYCTHFGFDAVFFDESFYLHLVHPANRSQLGFLLENHPSQPEFLHARANRKGIVISLEVSNIDDALASTTAAGLELVFPRTEEPWRQIHFMIKDPAGFLLDIVETVSAG